MMNHYERERFAQAHRQNLLREAEHERLLEQLPRSRRRVPNIALRLKLSWQALRMRRRQDAQSRSAGEGELS
ncbi:MAG TPA: hypothetical protein VFQ36_08580 [Ktedonobacteraceae bacterium]|nr:hypothetical protein [Ktedonobacteraceae bacterium]